MKIIFVPVTDKPECTVALHQAFKLANHINASVKGCHIRAHHDSKVTFPSEANAQNNLTDASESSDIDVSAKNLFATFAQDYGFKLVKKTTNKSAAYWLEVKGSVAKMFSIHGLVADVSVVSRPLKQGKSLAKDFMLAAILKSARPVIILPQTQVPDIGQRISIAWNQSTQAMRAIVAALPVLMRAKEVNIITCQVEDKLAPKTKHLINYLQAWNITAKHIISQGSNDALSLLEAYKQTHSDLMVMGGYSHSRLKQLIWGGVTDYMLNQADIPVFMLHSK